jgi:hypothetical protein
MGFTVRSVQCAQYRRSVLGGAGFYRFPESPRSAEPYGIIAVHLPDLAEENAMSENGHPDYPQHKYSFPRGPDRRHSNQIAPPPFITDEGLVMIDRRSHLDRRSSWIRDFFIDFGHWQGH